MDKSHIRLSYITHFYCNQQNIDSVICLLRLYEQYDPVLLDVIEFVVVDDGSPITYSLQKFNLNLTWLRINEDIPWNQAGARNLGVTYAKSDRIVLTDLDHMFPEMTLRYMAYCSHPGRNFFKIYRACQETGKIIRAHWNIFYFSRARFLRLYGYDEAFAGRYGFEDLWLSRFQKYLGSRQCYLPKKYRCFERQVDRNKSYHSLIRDMTENREIYNRKKKEFKCYGQEFGHSRIFLNFTWQMMLSHCRKLPKKRIKKYYNFWWLRYFSSYLAR
ncbi:MAG: glycosyltransferase family A protein [Rickettsiella sp.]|nr:glycosyltransferase family A protein [Rickettsiella sp.]